jgi:hypothetical protein
MTKLLDNFDITSRSGCSRQRCQVIDEVTAARACEVDDGEEGTDRRRVYNVLELSHHARRVLVARSFTAS